MSNNKKYFSWVPVLSYYMILMHSDMRYASSVVIYFGMAAASARGMSRDEIEKLIQDLTGIKSRFLFAGKHGSTKWTSNLRGDDVLKLCAVGRDLVDKLFEGVELNDIVRSGKH